MAYTGTYVRAESHGPSGNGTHPRPRTHSHNICHPAIIHGLWVLTELTLPAFCPAYTCVPTHTFTTYSHTRTREDTHGPDQGVRAPPGEGEVTTLVSGTKGGTKRGVGGEGVVAQTN